MINWLRNYRYRRIKKQFRKEMFLWGIDLSHKTDEELEEDLEIALKAMCAAGITVEEFGQRAKLIYAKGADF